MEIDVWMSNFEDIQIETHEEMNTNALRRYVRIDVFFCSVMSVERC